MENQVSQSIGDGIYVDVAAQDALPIIVRDTMLTNAAPYQFCCDVSNYTKPGANVNAAVCSMYKKKIGNIIFLKLY